MAHFLIVEALRRGVDPSAVLALDDDGRRALLGPLRPLWGRDDKAIRTAEWAWGNAQVNPERADWRSHSTEWSAREVRS